MSSLTLSPTLSETTPFQGISPYLVSEVFAGMDITSRSREQYERDIGRFLCWVEEEGLGPDVLVRFKNHLRGDLSISTSSKSKYLTVSRVFVLRLVKLGFLPFEVEVPKGFQVGRSHKKRPLTKSDVSRILSQVESDAFLNALVHLLYYQGLRGNEARNLQVEDVELGNGGFYVCGKGRDGDREWMRFHPRTLKVVGDYLREMGISSGYLFPSSHNPSRPISQPTMWRHIKKVFESVGVESNPHAFRKSFVSGLIEGGLDLITVSRFSRHKSIQQLQTYYDRVSVERSFPQFVESLEVSDSSAL
jgi:integrase/recombinase XerC